MKAKLHLHQIVSFTLTERGRDAWVRETDDPIQAPEGRTACTLSRFMEVWSRNPGVQIVDDQFYFDAKLDDYEHRLALAVSRAEKEAQLRVEAKAIARASHYHIFGTGSYVEFGSVVAFDPNGSNNSILVSLRKGGYLRVHFKTVADRSHEVAAYLAAFDAWRSGGAR